MFGTVSSSLLIIQKIFSCKNNASLKKFKFALLKIRHCYFKKQMANFSESNRSLKKRVDDGDSIYLVCVCACECVYIWFYLVGSRLRTVILAGPQTP